jgi:hypothetical protein
LAIVHIRLLAGEVQFRSGEFYVGFVVNKVGLGHSFFRLFQFTAFQLPFHQWLRFISMCHQSNVFYTLETALNILQFYLNFRRC